MPTPKILLVTVTEVEARAVLDVCGKKTQRQWERRIIDGKTYYMLGQIGDADIYMVQSEMGSSTPGGALITIYKAIVALKPDAVIMVGIAFGTKPCKQKLGDILVAKLIMNYEPGKEADNFIPRGVRVDCSSNLLDKFRSGKLDWVGADIYFGLVLSGEKLVNNKANRDRLISLEPEAIGGEMEGAGLYVAASESKTDWILIKGICDWADGTKVDDAQKLAAENAASFVTHVISLGGLTDAKKAIPDGPVSQTNLNENSAEDNADKVRKVFLNYLNEIAIKS